jgi:hypothetical protein
MSIAERVPRATSGDKKLDHQAIALAIGTIGFEALRGPAVGGGAAPTKLLSSSPDPRLPKSRNTITSRARKGLPKDAPARESATPFDYAMTQLFDWETNGGRDAFIGALGVFRSFAELDVMHVEEAMRLILRLSIDAAHDPKNHFLVGYGVQAFIIQYLQMATSDEVVPRATTPSAAKHRRQTKAWASWLRDRRLKEMQTTTEAFEVLLSIGLLMLRRRPKVGYSVSDIVRSAQALWAGSVFRSLIEPEAYPEYHQGPLDGPDGPVHGFPIAGGAIERAMVDVILAMSEPGIFTRPATRAQAAVIEAALKLYRRPDPKRTVAVPTAARDAGIPSATGLDYFRGAEELARACLQHLGANWVGFIEFARAFRHAALPAAETVLLWVEDIHREYPHLLARAGFVPNDPAFEEIAHFVATAVSPRHLGVSVQDRRAELRRARELLERVTIGGDANSLLKSARRTWPSSIPL